MDGTPTQNKKSQKQNANRDTSGAVRVTQIYLHLFINRAADTSSSSALIIATESTGMPASAPTQQQPETNFQQMYAGPDNPLVDAANVSIEPMAANEALGGGGFGGLSNFCISLI